MVEEENDAHRLHSFSSCLPPSPSSPHGRTPEEPRANKRDSPFTPLPPSPPPPCDPTAPVEPTLPPLLLHGSSSLLSLAMSEEIVTVAVRGMPHNQPRADLLLPPPHIGRDPARHEERSGWNCWPPVRPSAVGLDSLAGISLLLSPIYPGGSSSSHLGWERGGEVIVIIGHQRSSGRGPPPLKRGRRNFSPTAFRHGGEDAQEASHSPTLASSWQTRGRRTDSLPLFPI